ncbi:MAG: amidohydrolase family protein [Nitrospirota bacterium]|nr:amidohydrolase family protein [Nitrospirota bacterium]
MAYSAKEEQQVIDIHVHGAGKFDTLTKRQDDVVHLAAIHGEHGTDAILPTVYPGDIEDMRQNMSAIRRAMAAASAGANILGIHVEGPFLNPSYAGALDRKSFLDPSKKDLDRLVDGFEDVIRIITIAPELPGALGVIERCREKGFLVQMGHSEASYEQAEEGKQAGATGITHIFNAMRSFHHREPGLAGFGLMDEDIYVEVISDLVHLHPQTLKMILDMKQTDRIILVSDSVKGPGWGKGAIRGPGGVLEGSGVTLMQCVRNLVSLGVQQEWAIQFATENPRRYLENR